MRKLAPKVCNLAPIIRKLAVKFSAFIPSRPSLTLIADHSFHFQSTDFALKPLHLCHTAEALRRPADWGFGADR